VKFLLDQNLSHRLVEALSDLYPGSAHVRDLGLQRADDAAVWQIASTRVLIIVTEDSDFRQRSFLLGAPSAKSRLDPPWQLLDDCHRGDSAQAALRA
jgi:predicted nuclease of predicted toxin-antitoxin system